MDIVYVFKNSPVNDSAELRYSLRSLRNLPHGKVYVVGEKPSWLTGAVHIPVVQDRTKYQNVSKNLQAAAKTSAISDEFILMNDDFFIMKPHDVLPVMHWGPMREVIDRFYQRYDDESDYMRKMKSLYELLRSQGHSEPLSYELHMPMVFNKANTLEMYAPEFGPIYQFRSMYGNHFHIGGRRAEDTKVYLDMRHNDPDYLLDPIKYLSSQTILSATGGSFRNAKVGEYVRAAFPDKSPYEI